MDYFKQCPIFLLYESSRKLIKIYSQELEMIGLTYPQYLVLSYQLLHDGCSVDSIGQALSLDSGTLTPLLKRLEKGGFIVRKRDTNDERKLVITLTPKGKKLEETFLLLRKKIRQSLGVTKEDVQYLQKTLHAINQQALKIIEG